MFVRASSLRCKEAPNGRGRTHTRCNEVWSMSFVCSTTLCCLRVCYLMRFVCTPYSRSGVLHGTVRPPVFPGQLRLLRGATAAARLYHPSGTLSQANHLLCVRLRSASPPGRRQALAPHTHCLASERSFRAQALLALCGVLLFDGLAAHVVEVPRGASSEQTHSYPLGSASSASW